MPYTRIALACIAAGGATACRAASSTLAGALPAGIPLGMFWRVIFPAMLLILALAVVLSCAYVQLRKEVARRRQVEARLRAARDLADSASLAKASFFATMSHEIRTPMSGIIGMLDLLKRESMRADQQQMLAAVDHAANSLLHILDGVLDFSKMEANRMHLESVPVDLRTLARSVVMVIGEPARRRGVKTELHIADSLAHEVLGDPLRIRQILSNLLSNAAKFTRQGTIVLTVTVEQSDSAGQLLRFSVIDTGIGIASGRLPHLLEPFEQAHASTSRQYGGSGLGLSVSNRLAALMHGKLRLASEPGQGTRADFTCRFPVHREHRSADPDGGTEKRAREKEAPEPERQERAFAPIQSSGADAPCVLVADDHGINRDLVRRQLTLLGLSCDVVEDAAGALEALRARPYALLLTDCQMPTMNGRELARQWREIERRAQRSARMPIVLMSATPAPAGEQEADSDIDARLFKPIKLDDLREALRRYLPGGTQAGANPGTGLAWPSLLQQFGSETAARRFVAASAAHLRQDLTLVREQCSANSCAPFADWIHRSIGAMAMLGHWPVMDEGTALERDLRQSPGAGHLPQIRIFLMHFEEALLDIERHARPA